MRTSVAVFSTFILLTTTGVTLAGLAATVSSPPPVWSADGPTETENSSLVRLFYSAINELTRTTKPARLDAILARDFVARGIEPGIDQDRAGFQEYLGWLSAFNPSFRLVVVESVAGQEAVVTRVNVVGGEQSRFSGATLIPARPVWGASNSFRIVGGRIVEFWGHADLVPRSQFSVELFAMPAEPVMIRLDRLRLSDVAGGVAPVDRWRRVIWVTSGSVVLSHHAANERALSGFVSITRQAIQPDGVRKDLAPGEKAILLAGDVAVIPGGIAYDLAGTGTAEARALGARLNPEYVVAGDNLSVDPRWGDAVARNQDEALSGWPPGAVVEPMVSWVTDSWINGSVQIIGGGLTLAPGASLALGQTTTPVLLVAEPGPLAITDVSGVVGGNQPPMVEHLSAKMSSGTSGSLATNNSDCSPYEWLGNTFGVVLAPGETVRLAASETEPVFIIALALLPASN